VVTAATSLSYEYFLSAEEFSTSATGLVVAPSINVVCAMTYTVVTPATIGTDPTNTAERVYWTEATLDWTVPLTVDPSMASSTAWTVTALPATPAGASLTAS